MTLSKNCEEIFPLVSNALSVTKYVLFRARPVIVVSLVVKDERSLSLLEVHFFNPVPEQLIAVLRFVE